MALKSIGEVIAKTKDLQQTQPSSPALTRRTQNAICSKREGAKPSLFGNMPEAGKYEVAMWAKRLAICFPAMPAEFWGLVAKKAVAECLSLKRLQYIEQKLTSEHQYSTLTMADIFKYDMPVKVIGLYEWTRQYVGIEVAAFNYGGQRLHTTIEEADRLGIEYDTCTLLPSGRVVINNQLTN